MKTTTKTRRQPARKSNPKTTPTSIRSNTRSSNRKIISMTLPEPVYSIRITFAKWSNESGETSSFVKGAWIDLRNQPIFGLMEHVGVYSKSDVGLVDTVDVNKNKEFMYKFEADRVLSGTILKFFRNSSSFKVVRVSTSILY